MSAINEIDQTKAIQVTKKIIPIPIILKSNKFKVLTANEFVSNVKVYQEDVIYENKRGDFLKLDQTKVLLFNRLHKVKNTNRTIVRYYSGSTYTERSSDSLVSLIGQDNYDTVFTALCSVISQELKVRGILSLLTPQNSYGKSQSTEAGFNKKLVDVACQSIESHSYQRHQFTMPRRRRLKKRVIGPYVIKEISIDSQNISNINDNQINLNLEQGQLEETREETVQPIVPLENLTNKNNSNENVWTNEENSNESYASISTIMSVNTTNNILKDFNISLYKNMFESDTNFILDIGNSKIELKERPKDIFHIATKENLQYLNCEDRKKLVLHQVYIDSQYCLIRDEDNNLPIHLAVMDNDVELLKRQCGMLKLKNQSVDIHVENFTALRMAVMKDSAECVSVLLKAGADPLQTDEGYRTPFHHAAEGGKSVMETLLSYCDQNARTILQENSELWEREFETDTDAKLSKHLLHSVCSMSDSQGYNPLMLASRIGNFENVQLLCTAGANVNEKMPTCGNTALYLTIAAASTEAYNNGNKTKISDKYQRTIEMLLNNGSLINIENYSGATTEALLSDLHIPELSALVAKKLTAIKCGEYFTDNISAAKMNTNVMLLKNDQGQLELVDIENHTRISNLKNKESVNACIETDNDRSTQNKSNESKINVNTNISGSVSNVANRSDTNIDTAGSNTVNTKSLRNVRIDKAKESKVSEDISTKPVDNTQNTVKIIENIKIGNSALNKMLPDNKKNKITSTIEKQLALPVLKTSNKKKFLVIPNSNALGLKAIDKSTKETVSNSIINFLNQSQQTKVAKPNMLVPTKSNNMIVLKSNTTEGTDGNVKSNIKTPVKIETIIVKQPDKSTYIATSSYIGKTNTTTAIKAKNQTIAAESGFTAPKTNQTMNERNIQNNMKVQITNHPKNIKIAALNVKTDVSKISNVTSKPGILVRKRKNNSESTNANIKIQKIDKISKIT